MTQQGIVKGDALQRISSAGFITAAILMVIGNLLMPYTTTPTSDLQEMLKPLGEHELRTEASSLLVTISFLAMGSELLNTAGRLSIMNRLVVRILVRTPKPSRQPRHHACKGG